jgi:hypothetical protein
MFGGTGYHTWYNAHASATVRLPRPKPFVERTFLRDDNIVETWDGT